MSNRCAIDKPVVYTNTSSVSPIKEQGKFYEEAKKMYSSFEKITSDNQSIYQAENKLLHENANYVTVLFENDWPNFNREDIFKKYPAVKKRIEAKPTVSVSDVNAIIKNSPVVTKDNFKKMIYDRYPVVPITPQTYPNTNDVYVSNNVTNILDAYEYYLQDSFYDSKMGKFCSLAPNIFSAIDEFSNFFDNISSISRSFDDLVSSFENMSAKAMLERLQNHVMSVVDSIMQNKLKILENFSISKLLNDKGFSSDSVSKRIYSKIQREKENVISLFSKENVEQIKEKIKGLLSYALGIFERRDIEEIEFLVYRFCNLMQRLEEDSDNALYKLKNYSDTIEYARTTISASSNAASARAIQAGAIRFEPQVYERAQSEQTNYLLQSSAQRNSNYSAPISSGDVDGITPWNDGNGDERIKFTQNWPRVLGRAGWEKVSIDARVKLMRVQKRFGKRLNINSGWRSPSYNASVNGKPGSRHLRGEALDISWSGFRKNSQEYSMFIQFAREEGFSGFGISYDTFIHIDIGPARSW